MTFKTNVHLLLLLFILTPSIFTAPSVLVPDDTEFLKSRETDDGVIIEGSDGKPVQIDLFWDNDCGQGKGLKPPKNGSAMIIPIKYGVDYSLKEQPYYNQALNGIFQSFSISRDIESNEQIDFSTYAASGSTVTNPAHPGCAQYAGSEGGNLSIGVKEATCMVVTAACFRLWRA